MQTFRNYRRHDESGDTSGSTTIQQ